MVEHKRCHGIGLAMMPPRTYMIHDNGGRPFSVEDLGGHVAQIRIASGSSDTEEDGDSETDSLIYSPLLQIEYLEIFPGRFPHRRWSADVRDRYRWRRSYVGNSVLLSVGDSKYVYIGESIWEFDSAGDRIYRYYSPIGNSDVPYPFAVGENFTYLMLEKVRIPNRLLDETEDPYAQFYGARHIIGREAHRAILTEKQTLRPTQIIHERLY